MCAPGRISAQILCVFISALYSNPYMRRLSRDEPGLVSAWPDGVVLRKPRAASVLEAEAVREIDSDFMCGYKPSEAIRFTRAFSQRYRCCIGESPKFSLLQELPPGIPHRASTGRGPMGLLTSIGRQGWCDVGSCFSLFTASRPKPADCKTGPNNRSLAV